MKHPLIVSLLGLSLAFSTLAFAAQDAAQRALIERVQEAKMKLKAAETTQGAEQQKLMEQHLKMMQEAMEKMQAMKPHKGMSMQEHEEWMNEHQKLMGQMMEQMMGEHHLMMQNKCGMMMK